VQDSHNNKQCSVQSSTYHSLIYFSASRPNNFTASLGSICMAASEHDSVVVAAAATSEEYSDDEEDDNVGL